MGKSKAPTHERMEAIFRNVVEGKHQRDLAQGVLPEFGPPLAISEYSMVPAIEEVAGVSRQTARRYLNDYLMHPEAMIWRVYVDDRGDILSRNIPSGWTPISSCGLTRSDQNVSVKISQSGYHLPWEPIGERSKDKMAAGDFLVLRSELDAAMSADVALKTGREQEYARARQAMKRDFDGTYPGLREALTAIVGGNQNPKQDGYLHIGEYKDDGVNITINLSGDSFKRMAEALGLEVKVDA